MEHKRNTEAYLSNRALRKKYKNMPQRINDSRNKVAKKMKHSDSGDYTVNKRYAIYKDDGVVYDTKHAKDVPQRIFKVRDELAKQKKVKYSE